MALNGLGISMGLDLYKLHVVRCQARIPSCIFICVVSSQYVADYNSTHSSLQVTTLVQLASRRETCSRRWTGKPAPHPQRARGPPGQPGQVGSTSRPTSGRGTQRGRCLEIKTSVRPERSVRGERANFTRLVLGCIEDTFSK